MCVVYKVPMHIYINICVYMYEPILGQLVTILVQDLKVETESLKNGTHFCVKNCPERN
jgi:hypothetical protein